MILNAIEMTRCHAVRRSPVCGVTAAPDVNIPRRARVNALGAARHPVMAREMNVRRAGERSVRTMC